MNPGPLPSKPYGVSSLSRFLAAKAMFKLPVQQSTDCWATRERIEKKHAVWVAIRAGFEGIEFKRGSRSRKAICSG